MNLGPLSIVSRGSHVKYFLRSGMVLEGIVEEDTASQVVLRSLDGESLMIIHRPTEDIMLTKVILRTTPEEAQVELEKPPIRPLEKQEQIKEKLHEALQTPDDPELQKKSIAELRQLVHEQERQIIAQKRREHFGVPGSTKMTQYSSPYMLRVHPRSNTARYQPGKLPNWVYGRSPEKK
jgi:hypothetical protein